MKKVINIFILTLTLLCSFFSFSPSAKVKGLEDNVEEYKTYVTISSFIKEDNKIIFKTANKLSVIDITYEYTYYKNNTLVGGLAQESSEFSKIDDYTYSFEVSDNIVGIKLHKVKYVVEDKNGIWTNDPVIGTTTSVGEIEPEYREHVLIKDGTLFTDKIGSYRLSTTDFVTYSNKLYFNFEELIVEQVTKATVNYHYYVAVEEPSWLFFTKSYNAGDENRTYEADVNNNVEEEYSAVQATLACAVFADCDGKYSRIEIEESDRDGYQWYVRLPDTTYTHVTYNSNRREVIDNAYAVKISYWDNETYYEDVNVLMDPSGWVEYEEGDNTPGILKNISDFLDRILTWIEANITIICIIIVIIVFVIICIIVGSIAKVIKAIFKFIKWIIIALYRIIKYTIGLPLVIIARQEKKKKENKEFDNKMDGYFQRKRERRANNKSNKQKRENKYMKNKKRRKRH